MRILLASHSPHLVGGSERSLVEIARYLRGLPDVDVLVAVPGTGALTEALAREQIKGVVLRYGWAVSSQGEAQVEAGLDGLIEMDRAVVELAPDVIVTNTSVIPWFGHVAYLRGIPHAWFLREDVDTPSGLAFHPDAETTRELIRRYADLVFVNSEFMRQRHVQRLGRSDIEVVYPSVDGAMLTRGLGAVAANDGKVGLITYGAILPAKNQMEVLEAIAVLKRTHENFRLTIMGFPASRDYFESLLAFVEANALQSVVRFLDHQDDPYPTVAAQQICIVPSVAEPFGRVTVEAMALKLAVVASDAGGNREILEGGDDVGVLYPLGQPAVLAERLAALLDRPDRVRELGARAHHYVAGRFVGSHQLASFHTALVRLAKLQKIVHADWISDASDDRHTRLIHELGARIASGQAELRQVREELREVRDDVRQTAEALRYSQRHVDALLGSLSWRLTSPLRAVHRLFARQRPGD